MSPIGGISLRVDGVRAHFDYVYVSNGIPVPVTPHGKISASWEEIKRWTGRNGGVYPDYIGAHLAGRSCASLKC